MQVFLKKSVLAEAAAYYLGAGGDDGERTGVCAPYEALQPDGFAPAADSVEYGLFGPGINAFTLYQGGAVIHVLEYEIAYLLACP